MNNLFVKTICFAVLINLVLPNLIMPYATDIQIKPPLGAASLNFFDQIIHMLVHHAQVPITSSMIIALIVGLSLYGAKIYIDYYNKSIPKIKSCHCNNK